MTDTAMDPDRQPCFSDELRSRFDGHTAHELLYFLCERRLGHGMSREVFQFAPAPHFVIKFELREGLFQNVAEWEAWQTVEHTTYAEWFAPCHMISGCGRILIQHYAEPIHYANLPDKVPAFFADLKPSNWGQINGKPVALDYGRSLLTTKGLSGRMRKASWL